MSLTPRTKTDLQKDFCFQYKITCTKTQILPVWEVTDISSTITLYSGKKKTLTEFN